MELANGMDVLLLTCPPYPLLLDSTDRLLAGSKRPQFPSLKLLKVKEKLASAQRLKRVSGDVKRVCVRYVR